MSSDCTVPVDDGFINVRVGAVIMKDGKFLMVGNEKQDYCYSVGGRVKFGESAEEAVKREVFEETGVKMEVDRLGFVNENFFYGDTERTMGKLIYEISFFFYMKVPEDFEPVSADFNEDGCKEHLVWMTADSPVEFYPEFFRTELSAPKPYVVHIVTDDRNKHV